MSFIKKHKSLILFLVITVIFCITSFLVRDILIQHLNNHNFGLFSVDYIKNYGAAFSLLHTHTSLLIVVSSIILVYILWYIINNVAKFSSSDLFFSSLLCSGIVCNLLERLLDGYVTDYIRINFVSFPIFNMSDLFISIGAFMLICNILFNNETDKQL